MLKEAAALAGGIERPYERGRALAALVPYADVVDDELVDKALDAATLVDYDAERAHVLSELLSAVGDDRKQTQAVRKKALEAARAITSTGIQIVGTISDDGIVDIAPTTPWLSSARSMSLAAIAASFPDSERDALLAEAVDAAYEFPGPQQVAALASLAPHLPEGLVRRVLTDLAVAKQPLRTFAAGVLLARANELGLVESAHDEAVRLWGATPPDDLLTALGDQESEPAEFEEVDGASEAEETRIDDGEDGLVTYSISLTAEPFWALLRLGGDGKFATVDFSPPPPWPAGAQPVEEAEASVLHGYLAWYVAQLLPNEVRALLDGPPVGALTWQATWVAMLSRLADLGFADSALEIAKMNWPEGLPPEAAVALAPHVSEPARAAAIEAALTTVETASEGLAQAQLLTKLVPHLPESKRERIVRKVEGLAQSVADVPASPSDLVEGLASVHSVLSRESSLALWQQELQAAAAGIRQELVDVLPTLLITGEAFDGNDMWEGFADTILDVQKWWP